MEQATTVNVQKEEADFVLTSGVYVLPRVKNITSMSKKKTFKAHSQLQNVLHTEEIKIMSLGLHISRQ